MKYFNPYEIRAFFIARRHDKRGARYFNPYEIRAFFIDVTQFIDFAKQKTFFS